MCDAGAPRAARPIGSAVRQTALLLIGALVLPGCEGCRREKDPTAEAPDAARREDYESSELQVLPTDGSVAAFGVKPGHWYGVRQQLKSNKIDFDGELETTTSDAGRNALRLTNSSVELRSRRPAALPKGQGKSFELTYFVPHAAARNRRVWLYSELLTRYGGSVRHTQPQVTNRLRPHQAYFVVLARNPDQYSYLKTLESVRPPSDEFQVGELPDDYLIVLPPPGAGTVPLPAWSMMWTSVAYLLWDDLDPALLSSEQQRALLDWLHWGGQLLINGPNSLETLRTSFLGPYLPAQSGPTQAVGQQQIAELNTSWSVPSQNRRIDTTLAFGGGSTLEALQLQLRDGGALVSGTADLVAERRVGRGRVTVTAFSLTRRELTNWRSFDNFFNACLLRRPAREYRPISESGLISGLICQWSEPVVRALQRRPAANQDAFTDPDSDSLPSPDHPSGQRSPNESLVTTRLRYFSRDAAIPPERELDSPDEVRSLDIEGYRCDAHAGIAGWNDFSECSRLARTSLTSAAGISVPDRGFVIGALALYLFVLVPANWTIFRALGRVEWAWVAVPVIALIGTMAVVRLAQLDIGFARSRTEIAVVETQPDYPRAHVTRYVGMYTSLSTDYRLSFADDSAVAAPFGGREARFDGDRGVAEKVVLERSGKRGANVQLHGLSVNSNSTEMVHAEQMLDLGGRVALNESPSGLIDVVNETPFDLLNVGVVRRRRGALEFAGLRLLASGATRRIEFRRLEDDQLWDAWQEVGATAEPVPAGVELAAFQRLAANPGRLNEGDARLVAWSAHMLPGMTIEPIASQQAFWNLWVVNLRYGDLPAPRSDINTPTDFPVEDSDD